MAFVSLPLAVAPNEVTQWDRALAFQEKVGSPQGYITAAEASFTAFDFEVRATSEQINSVTSVPTKIRDAMTAALLSAGSAVHDFQFWLNPDTARAVQVVGVAFRYLREGQARIRVAYVTGLLHAHLQPAIETYTVKTCERVLGVCVRTKHHTEQRPRGYTADEIQQIRLALEQMLQSSPSLNQSIDIAKQAIAGLLKAP